MGHLAYCLSQWPDTTYLQFDLSAIGAFPIFLELQPSPWPIHLDRPQQRRRLPRILSASGSDREKFQRGLRLCDRDRRSAEWPVYDRDAADLPPKDQLVRPLGRKIADQGRCGLSGPARPDEPDPAARRRDGPKLSIQRH